jgi:uncharacterized membrane protein YdfJ with MMPL/SSD domain
MRQLAKIIINHPRLVILTWLIVLALSILPAGTLSDRVSNGGYEVAGSQSQRAEVLDASRFSQGVYQQLFVTTKVERENSDRLARDLRAALQGAGVAGIQVLEPQRRGDVLLIPFLVPGDIATAQKLVTELRPFVTEADARAQLLGEGAVWEEATAIAEADLTRGEALALPLTLLVLLIAFLSAVAAGIPIALALVSLVVTFAALALLGSVMNLSVYVTNTASVIMLGLAIDYSLFIISRYRELRRESGGVAEPLEETLATTGRAVLLSGLTIAVGLSSLLVIGVGVSDSMAVGASLAAAIAALGALTLVPAILCVIGSGIDRFQLRTFARAAESARLWKGLARQVLKRPWFVLCSSAAVLAVFALPLTGARLTYPSGYELLPAGNEVREAGTDVIDAFGPGTLGQLLILTSAPAERALATVDRHSGIATAEFAGTSGDLSRIIAVPTVLGNTPEADQLIHKLRADLPRELGADVLVGGPATLGPDLVDRIESRLPWMIIVACGLSFVLLLLAFRSIAIPIKAILTNLLSVAATLGIVTFLFQVLGNSDGIAWFVPPFLFAIVFGLSMDYEIFLLSRVRDEHLRGATNAEAISQALVRSARPITFAALVMMIVFLGFGLARLETFQQLGVGMAIAILLDATLVRCALVPAALALLGDRNWWIPSWLDRVLPGNRATQTLTPHMGPAEAESSP